VVKYSFTSTVVELELCGWLIKCNLTHCLQSTPVQHRYVAQPVDTPWIHIPYGYVSHTRWIRIQQVSEKNKSDTRADPYWVTIPHHWIRFGPAHLNKHACQASRSSSDRLEEEPGHAWPQGAGAEPQPPVRGPPPAQGGASMDGYHSCGRRLTRRMMDGAAPVAAR
jgi:hypothetical protein